MALCLGPTGSGKTLLLKKLQNTEQVDETSSSVPTVGTMIFRIKRQHFEFAVRELGGTMAPLWKKYYSGVTKVIYVVDASNLCQISAAGVLLYEILAHPLLKSTKFLLVLTKMDASYRQMRNEALLMLQINNLQKEIRHDIKIIETSAITGLKMYMNDVNKKEEIKNVAIKDLRGLGIKYRPKKQRNLQDTRIGRRVFKTVLHLLPMQTVTLKTGQQLIVPKLVNDLCSFILSKVETEGLFRKGGSKARQNEIKLLLDTGCQLGGDHHEIDVANVLKTFFRELPEPLFPYSYHELFLHCALSDRQLDALFLSCLLLPIEHLNTLAYFMQFLQEVTEYAHLNKMDSYNLAVVIGPTLFPIEEKLLLNSAHRLSKICEICKLLIENAPSIGIISERIIDQIASDSTTDSLPNEEAVNKRKKKRSGSLTRMFNGLKKIVSSKSIENSIKSPDLLQTPNIRKSERKRKLEAQGFTNKKKHALLQNLPQGTALSTPISMQPNLKKLSSPQFTKTNMAKDRKSQSNLNKRNKHNKQSDVPTALKRHWSAVSQAASGFKRNKIRNSIATVHAKTEEPDYVKISRSEYEDIQKRVMAIERRISIELDNIEQVDSVEKVQCAYEKTLVESEHLSPTTDQLAKRLSKELKIRRSTEQKVVRSPSARKIGSLRRRSRELERQNIRLRRNHSLQLNAGNKVTTLRRGQPNSLWTGLPHPQNIKCDAEVSCIHSSEPQLVIVRSGTIDMETTPSHIDNHLVPKKWTSEDDTYLYKMQTPQNQNIEAQYRSSIVKLRNQNAGMVLAKAKLFNQLIDSDSSTTLSATKLGTRNIPIRNVSQRIRGLKLDEKRVSRQSISPRKKSLKNTSALSDMDEKENQMQNLNCADIVNSNDKGQVLKDCNRLTSPSYMILNTMPQIKKTLNTKSPRRICHTPVACDSKQTPLKPLSSQRFY
ncbi:hypothetical protein RN001_001981 [Aquatica leii]|uniref:Rho-GAP domain-containing protein n=1 Tax=Aquatica leii TaxID=1421715 RepID=A0AAN7QAT3_9COLE|nr:hypothetical protein RN001_001981 [Aquatica leii]